MLLFLYNLLIYKTRGVTFCRNVLLWRPTFLPSRLIMTNPSTDNTALSRTLTLFSLALFVLMLTSAAWQYNDEGWHWGAYYVAAAVGCILFLTHYTSKQSSAVISATVLYGFFAVQIVWSLFLLYGAWRHYDRDRHIGFFEAEEIAGACFVLASVFYHIVATEASKQKKT